MDASARIFGSNRAIALIGRAPAFIDALDRLARYADAEAPILITGETGSGKDMMAKGVHCLGPKATSPMLSVNCAQYQDGQLLASELFGHKKGTFTGALADRRGIFEEADGGLVFLDEVAELALPAQAMLLRVLGEGEVIRVGECHPRRVCVRVVAATARPLEHLVARGAFREDLFFRLRFLRLRVPSLRDRGNDWRLLAHHHLSTLNAKCGRSTRLSARSIRTLESYGWPGNVRELRSIIEIGFYTSPRDSIEPEDFASELAATPPRPAPVPGHEPAPLETAADHHLWERYRRMAEQGESFWDVIHKPYMDRDLNRAQVTAVIAAALARAGGRYKRTVQLLGMEPDSYLKFMDFLRHQRLKPRAADEAFCPRVRAQSRRTGWHVNTLDCAPITS
jgi:DNA-binding NtrC family response regulator